MPAQPAPSRARAPHPNGVRLSGAVVISVVESLWQLSSIMRSLVIMSHPLFNANEIMIQAPDGPTAPSGDLNSRALATCTHPPFNTSPRRPFFETCTNPLSLPPSQRPRTRSCPRRSQDANPPKMSASTVVTPGATCRIMQWRGIPHAFRQRASP